MTNFSDSLGETASYSYYSDGLRASKTIGSNTTKYYYDGDNVINETLNGSSYATNVLGVNGYTSRRQDGTTGYLFKNAHGDVVSAHSSTTNKIADYTYDAWGEQRTTGTQVWGASNPIRYNGQYYDTESGMTYLRARYYDSDIKRFISEDPAKDGLNWYAYANNNPVMFVDPSGETFLIGWSYGKADLADYTDFNGNVNWTKFTAENSFARAAYTRRQELIDSGVPASDIDIQRIDNEQDMKDTWNMWAGYSLVEGLDLFSHGSSSGPIVAGGGGSFLGNSDTAKLNWGESLRMINGVGMVLQPKAIFHGCNTANGDFAQNFANNQGVNTYAQTGNASFSTNPTWHYPIKDKATTGKVYLFHFAWINLKNDYGWGKLFKPNK